MYVPKSYYSKLTPPMYLKKLKKKPKNENARENFTNLRYLQKFNYIQIILFTINLQILIPINLIIHIYNLKLFTHIYNLQFQIPGFFIQSGFSFSLQILLLQLASDTSLASVCIYFRHIAIFYTIFIFS